MINVMTPRDEFMSDVAHSVFEKYLDTGSTITISELDQIVYAHPYYEQVSLETIEDAVQDIEIMLTEDGLI